MRLCAVGFAPYLERWKPTCLLAGHLGPHLIRKVADGCTHGRGTVVVRTVLGSRGIGYVAHVLYEMLGMEYSYGVLLT
jgi:hypothetical protein